MDGSDQKGHQPSCMLLNCMKLLYTWIGNNTLKLRAYCAWSTIEVIAEANAVKIMTGT